MPAFKDLDQIKDHAKYKAELKSVLKTAPGKKFLYFKKHKFTPGRNHLLVVDCDIGISKMLGAPTAEGKCALNEAKQLVMETTKGTWKVRPLKKYVETFYSEREIWVSPDEPEEAEKDESLQTSQDTRTIPVQPQAAGTSPTVAPASPPSPGTKSPIPVVSASKPPSPQSPSPQTTAVPKPPPTTLPSRPPPPSSPPPSKVSVPPQSTSSQTPIAPKPAPTLPSRPAPPTSPPTTQAKAPPSPSASPAVTPQPSGIKPPASPVADTSQVRKERKLSAYMTGKRIWREARIGAEAELQRLEKVIITTCDGEPFAPEVAAKTRQLFALLAQLDDSLGDRLDQASTTEDPEKQAHLDKQALQVIQKNRNALKSSPLAAVVDSNPFGTFNVRTQLDTVLAKLENDFL